jgi:hypothetical protein
MAASWPVSINTDVLRDGYTDQPERNVVTFQPEVGPAKERRRCSVSNNLVTYPMMFLAAEWAAFVPFYRSTLADGILPFEFPDPVSDDLWTYKFEGEEPPKVERVQGLYRYVTLHLRVLYEGVA